MSKTRQETFAEEERMVHLLRCHISREHARLIVKSTDDEWEFSIGYDTWRAMHADGWYTHPNLPTVLVRRIAGSWRLYAPPFSCHRYAGGFGPAAGLLKRVDPALTPAWRTVVEQ